MTTPMTTTPSSDASSPPESVVTVPTAPPLRKGVLAQLAQRRDQIVNAQVLVVPVPRWTDPELKIRFGPVDHDVLKRSMRTVERAFEKEKDPRKLAEIELNSNADVLVNAAIEVLAVIDGKDTSLGLDGEPVSFGPDLAVGLGLPQDVGARVVCRHLFVTDGDLLTTARQLSDWSGYRDNSADEELAGE